MTCHIDKTFDNKKIKLRYLTFNNFKIIFF